jgi:predicted NBD/HSP70 family sugar kinase
MLANLGQDPRDPSIIFIRADVHPEANGFRGEEARRRLDVCDVAVIGYPDPVLRGRPIAEPYNLGRGWIGFDFGAALGCPVKVVNDAAMQALLS